MLDHLTFLLLFFIIRILVSCSDLVFLTQLLFLILFYDFLYGFIHFVYQVYLMSSNTPVCQESKQQVKNKFANQHSVDQQCPICLDNPMDITTICNHKFCKVSIYRILKVHNNCPICRKFNPLIVNISENKINNQPSQQEWNLQVARQIVYKELGNGTQQVQIVNTDGTMEDTNIFVGKGAQINVSPGANILINGKKVVANQCNHQ